MPLYINKDNDYIPVGKRISSDHSYLSVLNDGIWGIIGLLLRVVPASMGTTTWSSLTAPSSNIPGLSVIRFA